MSESVEPSGKSVGSDGSADLVDQAQPTKPIHTIIGAAVLIACIAVCGNFFGWIGGKKVGLGVSREQAVQSLSQYGLGFRPGADQRGLPTEEATSPDGRSMLRLVGPKGDLAYVSITSSLGDKPTNTESTMMLLYQAALLQSVLPDWTGEDIGKWLNESVNKMARDPTVGQIEAHRGSALVKLSLSRSPLTLTVSVESERW